MKTACILLLIVFANISTGRAELDALPRGIEQLNAAGAKVDLDEIRARGYIRILTRNNPQCYFMHRGQLMGFEYELAQRFAKQLGVEVFVVVPDNWYEMERWLEAGRADLIAACYTITPTRLANKRDLSFCSPYGKVHEMIVTRREDDRIRTPDDLAGRTIHVRPGSSYHDSLLEFRRETGIDFSIVAAPQSEETFTILHKVASGDYDMTCADETFLDGSLRLGEALKPVLRLRQPRSYGWMVRRDQPQLQDAINRFFDKELESGAFDRLYSRYFDRQAESPLDAGSELMDDGRISPYDELVKQSASEFRFPWTLICSQMFQESSFRADAVSWSGAQGLMQLMPATAGEMGLKDPFDPAQNIRAGVHYLRKQYDRVPDEVDPVNRTCFALACYNGGYGHLIDARRLAGELGRNPNVWVDNVDHAYALLSEPDHAKKARYGYCRSDEIINYVRKIMARYIAYDTANKKPGLGK